MLKSIQVNKKKIPVPVPVKTLDEALDWLERTLVPDGHTVTRVVLDGHVLTDQDGPWGNPELGSATKLEVQVDSPVELAVQTLDAVRNLGAIIGSGLKPLAVSCWQAKPVDKPRGIDTVVQDANLVLDLIGHLEGLLDPDQVETAGVYALARLLDRDSVALSMAVGNSDWKAAARILLNRIEPVLSDLTNEAESLQIRVLALRGHHDLAKAGGA